LERVVSFEQPMGYDTMTKWLGQLQEKYPEQFDLLSIGSSWMERQLCCAALGSGEEAVVYVGTHHAMEWVGAQILMRFLEDALRGIAEKSRIMGYYVPAVFQKCRLYIIPMLNPDGVELCLSGIEPEHFLYERLVRQNGGSSDFSRWQANLRGVDLNHNYDYRWNEQKEFELQNDIVTGGPTRYGGESPESEKETAALCGFLRVVSPRLLISFHSQGEEIFCDMSPSAPHGSLNTASLLARLCGYRLSEAEGFSACGGLKDWFMKIFNKPAYTVELGRGENPLPLSDFEGIYKKILPLLLTAPVL